MNGPGSYYRMPGADPRDRLRRLRRTILVVTAAFVLGAALVLLVLLDPTLFGLAAPTYPYRFGVFGGVFFVFFILIVGFFIVRVLFWSSRAARYGGRGGSGPNRPAMIARMRYARGEISREQYEQIMQDLGRRPGAP